MARQIHMHIGMITKFRKMQTILLKFHEQCKKVVFCLQKANFFFCSPKNFITSVFETFVVGNFKLFKNFCNEEDGNVKVTR